MTAFLLAVGLIFVTAFACGSLAARVTLPRVVGELAAGLVLGQSLLGHVWPRAEHYLFGSSTTGVLRLVGTLVVLLYVALVGSELDVQVSRGLDAHFLAAVGVALAAAIGGAAAVGFSLSDLEPKGVPRWTYFVFLTGALLVTAVPVLIRILDETGLTSTRIGGITLTLSIADDFVAFSMVAIAIAVATNGSLGLAIGGTVVLAALALAAKLVWARRWVRSCSGVTIPGIAILALVVGAVNSLGASTLVASFIVGVLVWRSAAPHGEKPPRGELIRLLVPLYIVYAGLSVDVSRLAQPRLVFDTLLVTLLAVLTKGVSCLLAGRLLSLSRRESLSLAVLRNTRGLTELVALNLGFQAGLLSRDLYTIFFSMALLTTVASGAVAMAALRPLKSVREIEATAGVPA
jgi:Kef-type K+ transport system membrane component KefB